MRAAARGARAAELQIKMPLYSQVPPPNPYSQFFVVLFTFPPLWKSRSAGVVTAYADGNVLRELSCFYSGS
jgi:hypothetical protein